MSILAGPSRFEIPLEKTSNLWYSAILQRKFWTNLGFWPSFQPEQIQQLLWLGSNLANQNLALPFQATQVHLQGDQVPAAKQIVERPDTTKQQSSVLTAINLIMQLKIAGFCTRKKQRQVGWLVIRLKVLNNLSIFWQLRLCLPIW